MKRIALVIVLTIGWLFSAVQAQHFVGAMVDGAAAWQLDTETDRTYPMIGGGASVGGVYQLQYDKLLLQTGLGVSQVWLRNGLWMDTIIYDTRDDQGYAFTYYGDLQQQTHQAMLTELTVPFMLGTKLRSFHLLVGAKLSVTVVGFTTQKAQLNTWGEYGDRYYGPLANMPEHGFYNVKEFESKGRIKFRPDVRLCAEVGYSWALTKEPVKDGAPILQVGAFVEYGILNTLQQEMIAVETEDEIILNPLKDTWTVLQEYPMDIQLNHVYTTFNPEQVMMNNLRAGIRVTVLLPIAEGKNPFCFCVDGAATRYN